MSIISESPTLMKYKDTMGRVISMYYPEADKKDLSAAIDYSINKRLKDSKARVNNSYTKKIADMTLLQISDYIASREPIVTAFGTMFKKHETVPNPLATVVQSFLDNRTKHKKMMFKYPKGSEMFEKYNLLQLLDKIDCNGLEVLTFDSIGKAALVGDDQWKKGKKLLG